MTRLSALSLAVLGIVNVAATDDVADPTGAWQWKYANQSAVHTLKLKLEGPRLTGTIKNFASQRESPIEDASFKDGIVSFKYTYTARGNDATSVASYLGKVSGDTIKGTVEFKHPDRTLSRDWYAERVK